MKNEAHKEEMGREELLGCIKVQTLRCIIGWAILSRLVSQRKKIHKYFSRKYEEWPKAKPNLQKFVPVYCKWVGYMKISEVERPGALNQSEPRAVSWTWLSDD